MGVRVRVRVRKGNTHEGLWCLRDEMGRVVRRTAVRQVWS